MAESSERSPDGGLRSRDLRFIGAMLYPLSYAGAALWWMQ